MGLIDHIHDIRSVISTMSKGAEEGEGRLNPYRAARGSNGRVRGENRWGPIAPHQPRWTTEHGLGKQSSNGERVALLGWQAQLYKNLQCQAPQLDHCDEQANNSLIEQVAMINDQ